MKLYFFGLALISAITAVIGAPAHAQNGSLTRSFVSSSGVDGNPCTIIQPCATFARAYTMVSTNGIVAALDPGKYGSLTIASPVTINGNGWAAITGPAGSNAITINELSGGNVSLIGLELDGAGAASAGIDFASSTGTLEVTNCAIRNFSGSGIAFSAPGTPANAILRLDVSDTVLANNQGHGAFVQPGGQGVVFATFNRVQARNNAQDGIGIYGNYSLLAHHVVIFGNVINSVVSGNSTNLHAYTSSTGAGVQLDISNTTVANACCNSNIGILADGALASIRVGRSQITANDIEWSILNQGTVSSYGDNYFDPLGGGSIGAPPLVQAQ
jgi:hypothetical protein